MKDILFKAKSATDETWRQGFYVEGETSYIYARNDKGFLTTYPVRHSTIGQFTGFTDHDGKMIFEGDIIKSRTGRPYIVLWNDEQGCWYVQCPDDDAYFFPLWEIKPDTEVWLVSNIHDKKETL